MSPSGLLAGYAADLALGDPSRLHPVAGFGRLAAALERRAWRPSRTAGAAYAVGLVSAVAVAVGLLERALRPLRGGRVGLAAAVTWAALGARSLDREGRAVAGLVAAGRLESARLRVRSLVGRDSAQLDGPQVCRAAVESIAENTADAVVGPLLWGALAGPGGAAAYRAANTLDARVGHRSARHERFGWAAARLDDALTWPAARIAALLTVVLAPAAGGCPRRAWRTLRRDGRAHPSPNAGPLEAAFAGALGVRLGGRNRYGERIEERPALGEGELPGPGDVVRAARLSGLVGGAAALGCAALAAAVVRA